MHTERRASKNLSRLFFNLLNMKKSITLLLLLCSMAVIGQEIPYVSVDSNSKMITLKAVKKLPNFGDSTLKIGLTLKYEGATLVPTPGKSDSTFVFKHNPNAELKFNPIRISGYIIGTNSNYQNIQSNTDTLVLNSGDPTTTNHLHIWAYKEQISSPNVCAVNHGILGCPSAWPVSFRVCEICLRHEKISTTYNYIEKVDKYEEAVKKIKPTN